MANGTNTPAGLERAIEELEALAESEYGIGLAELLDTDDPWSDGEYDSFRGQSPSNDAVWRIGRLMGISIKDPFATSFPREDEVSQTGANYVWTLKPRSELIESPPFGTEYDIIEGFITAEEPGSDLDWLPGVEPEQIGPADVADFLEATQTERGTFRTLMIRARRYLCDDEELRTAVKAARKRHSKGRLNVANMPTLVAVEGVTQIANEVCSLVPWLHTASNSTFVAGLAFLLLTKGVDGLCDRTLPPPLTTEIET